METEPVAQHDDHIWLTVGGEAWAIKRIRQPYFYLWRGYWPNLEYTIVYMSEFDPVKYVERAVAQMEGSTHERRNRSEHDVGAARQRSSESSN
jgi:hypothetical protein